jgi:hypothetical protein
MPNSARPRSVADTLYVQGLSLPIRRYPSPRTSSVGVEISFCAVSQKHRGFKVMRWAKDVPTPVTARRGRLKSDMQMLGKRERE